MSRNIQEIMETGGLFLLLISFALLNGFPLYFSDSVDYAGFKVDYSDIRSWVLAALASPLWPILGGWATPVINSVVLAYVTVKFWKIYLPNVRFLFFCVAILLSMAPFHASAIMADIWIVTGVLALILLSGKRPLPLILISIISIIVHSSHAFVLIPVSIVILFFSREKKSVCVSYISIFFISAAISGYSHYNATTVQGKVKLGWAAVGSRILNDVPQTYGIYCRANSSARLCTVSNQVEPVLGRMDDRDFWILDPDELTTTEVYYGDDRFIWHLNLGDPTYRLNIRYLNQAGPSLLWIAVSNFPVDVIKAVFFDVVSVIKYPGFGYSGWMEDRPNYISPLQSLEPKETLARNGIFWSANAFVVNLASRSVLYSFWLVSLIYLAFHRPADKNLVAWALAAASLSNLLFYVLVSGEQSRYHARGLMICSLFCLVALDYYLNQRSGKRKS